MIYLAWFIYWALHVLGVAGALFVLHLSTQHAVFGPENIWPAVAGACSGLWLVACISLGRCCVRWCSRRLKS